MPHCSAAQVCTYRIVARSVTTGPAARHAPDSAIGAETTTAVNAVVRHARTHASHRGSAFALTRFPVTSQRLRRAGRGAVVRGHRLGGRVRGGGRCA
jgi:hypothetical protein